MGGGGGGAGGKRIVRGVLKVLQGEGGLKKVQEKYLALMHNGD